MDKASKGHNRFDPANEFNSDTHAILNALLIDYPATYHWLACPGLTPCVDCPHHPDTHQDTLIVAAAGVAESTVVKQDDKADGSMAAQRATSNKTTENQVQVPQIKAAVGVFFGTESIHNVSVLPIIPRATTITSTSQLKTIAELMAALAAMDKALVILSGRAKHKDEWTLDTGVVTPKRIIVKMSCEIVVRGITERLGVWNRNGFRAAREDRFLLDNGENSDAATNGTKIAATSPSIGYIIPNADLWQALAVRIHQVEHRHDVQVLWWCVQEHDNLLSVALAQQAVTGDRSVFAQARAQWVGQQEAVWKEWVEWHEAKQSKQRLD